MKHVFFLCFFAAFALSIKAEDPVNSNFFSLKKSYDFELPMFDLSLELPANAGFRVPFWNKKNAFLNINERNVSYCCSKAAILSENPEFTFSLPKQNTKALGLSIEKKTVLDFEKNLEEIRESESYLSDLPPMEGQLGTYYGFLTGEENWEVRFYFLQKDSLSFMFAIYSENEKEIKQCEEIIQSLRAVDLNEERGKYLEMVKNGYFEKQEKADSNAFVSDTTRVQTTFSFPELGLKMLFPENWIYSFLTEKKDVIHSENKLEIHWGINDLLRMGSLHFNAYNGDLSAFATFYPKTEKSEEIIRNTIENQQEIKRFPVLIDGLEGEAVAVGMPSMPTIHFRLTLDSYIFQFTAINVTADNLQLLQSFISNIKISYEQKKDILDKDILLSASPILPLSQQLDIKAFKPGELPVTRLKQTEPEVDIKTIPASFKDAGISFMLPLLNSTYCLPQENCVSIDKKSIVVAGKPSADKGNLSITAIDENSKNMISVTLSTLNSASDFETYFKAMVENWKTYNSIKMKRTEFVMVNGQKWGIMEYVQSGKPVCMMMTYFNDYFITVSYSGDSEEYKALTENMLFSFFE